METWQRNLGLNDLNTLLIQLREHVQLGTRIFLFSGEVGAGKTHLIKQLSRAIGIESQVQSPTFGIVHDYRSDFGKVQHSDWYRLNSAQELFEMGIYEALESDIWFIEWPEIGMALLQDFPFVHVTIATPENIDQLNRSYRIEYNLNFG
jgi:tRNA threonylcarbamoyladenosine biosynthesis protein TsaE